MITIAHYAFMALRTVFAGAPERVSDKTTNSAIHNVMYSAEQQADLWA